MRKLLWLFVLVAVMPYDAWVQLGPVGQQIAMEYVGAAYLQNINPKCAEAEITAFQGEDGNIWFDAVCLKEKPQA